MAINLKLVNISHSLQLKWIENYNIISLLALILEQITQYKLNIKQMNLHSKQNKIFQQFTCVSELISLYPDCSGTFMLNCSAWTSWCPKLSFLS